MKFKVAAVFSDNMVLQRHKPMAVFGEGENGKCIKVTFKYNEDGQKKVVEADTKVVDNRWCLYLPAMKENTDCIMVVSDGEEIKEYKNIAIGEVWFCGGQSNMEFELQNITGGQDYLKNDHPNVRFYNVQRKAYIDAAFIESEENTSWTEFNSESAKTWSGVGYLYGKKLSEELGVTVGLVGCNWGGTSASAWMSKEYLASDKDAATYLEDYDKAVEGKSEEQLIKEYEDYLVYEVEWTRKCDECYATIPGIGWDEVQERIGKCQWPGPMCSRHPFRPSGLYETMLKRIVPYSMRGFIYYQGESDDHKPHYYYKLMSLLIKQWRSDWNDENMPFFHVQLPGHRYVQDEDRKNWCIIREAQEKVAETIPNTGMAVIIDAGEFNDIHPKNKVPVADRLYRQAMYKVYGSMSEKEAESPVLESCVIEGEKAIVTFKYASDGLEVVGDISDIIGFEISGKDKVYHPAKAWIDGSKVVVCSESVKEPVAVRYIWTNYPENGVNLYSKYGLPVAPFRSDVDEDENTHYEKIIHQILELQ